MRENQILECEGLKKVSAVILSWFHVDSKGKEQSDAEWLWAQTSNKWQWMWMSCNRLILAATIKLRAIFSLWTFCPAWHCKIHCLLIVDGSTSLPSLWCTRAAHVVVRTFGLVVLQTHFSAFCEAGCFEKTRPSRRRKAAHGHVAPQWLCTSLSLPLSLSFFLQLHVHLSMRLDSLSNLILRH